MTPSVPKKLLTTREVAEELDVSIWTVRLLAAHGALPGRPLHADQPDAVPR